MKNRLARYVAFFGVLAIVVLAMGHVALAQVNTNSPLLPPNDGVYRSPDDVHAEFSGPNLAIVLESPEHKPFADRVERVQEGTDELEFFNSELTGLAVGDYFGFPISEPVVLTGPVTVRVRNYAPGQTGSFDTEIVAMDLTGSVGPLTIQIRENPSPTAQSLGQTDINDLGGGQWQVDSFFDVFTELSLDGGNSWISSTGPNIMMLVPEPGSLSLLGIGVIGLLGYVWRRKRGT